MAIVRPTTLLLSLMVCGALCLQIGESTDIATNVSFLLGDELSTEVYRRGNVWTLIYAYDPKHPRVVSHIKEVLVAANGLPALAETISAGIVSSSGDVSDVNLASIASRIPSALRVIITDGVSYYPTDEKAFTELKQQQQSASSSGPQIYFPEDIGRGSKDSSGAAVLQELGVDRFPALVLLKDGVPIEAITPEAAGLQVLGRLQAHLESHLDWELLVSSASTKYLPAAVLPTPTSPDDDDDDSALSTSSFDSKNVESPFFADGPGKASVRNASDLVGSVVDSDSLVHTSFSGVSSTILVDTIRRITASNNTQSVVVVPPTAIVDAALRRILGGAGCTILRPLAGSAGHNVLYGEETEFGNYMFVFAPEVWIPSSIRQGRRDGGDPHGRAAKKDGASPSHTGDESSTSEGDEMDVDDDDWLSLQRRRYPGYISLTDHELLPGTWLDQLRSAGIAVVGVPHYSSTSLQSADTPWWIGVPQQHQSLTASFAGVSTGSLKGPSSISQSQAFQHSDLQRLAAVALPAVASGSNHLLSFPSISARAPCTVSLFLKETSGETDQSYEARLKRVASMPLVAKKKKSASSTSVDDDDAEVLTLGDVCTFVVLDADVHSRHFVSFGFLFKNLYRSANELKEAYQMYGRVGTGGRDPSTNIRLKFSDHLLGIQHNNRKYKYPHSVLDVGLVTKYLRKVLSGDAPRSRVSEQHFGIKETDSAVLYGGASQWRPLVYSLPSGDDLLQDGLLDVTRDTLFIMVPNDVLRLCSVFRSTSALPSLVHSSLGDTKGPSGANVGSMLPTYRLTHTCSSYTTLQEQQRDLFSLTVSKEERRNALVSPTAAQILTERYGTLLSAIDEVLYKLASVGAGKHVQVFLWNAEQNDWPPFVDPTKFGASSQTASSKKTAANKKKKAKRNKKQQQDDLEGGAAHTEVSDAGTVKDDDGAALKLAKTLAGYLGRVLTRDSIRIGYVSSRTKFEFISGKSDVVSGPPTMRVIGVHDVTSLHHDEQGVPRYMPISQLSLSSDSKVPKARLETFLRESSDVISSLLDQEPTYDVVENSLASNSQTDENNMRGAQRSEEDEGEF